jgi:signal transduction histidine kinase
MSASGPELPPASETAGRRRYPLRFVWQMDEDGRFTLDSDEFVALVGPRTAAAIGQPWQAMAAELGLDPEGRVARAVATRDTWSGLCTSWPIDKGPERLAVELSGLPLFDRDGIFRGCRGFGVCRDGAGLAAAQRRHLPSAAARATASTSGAPSAAAGEVGRPTLAPAPGAENVVPFRSPATEPSAPALSPVERSAFHELSRKLAQRLASTSAAPRAEVGASSPGTGHGPGASAAPAADAGGAPAHALAVALPAPARPDLAETEIAELGSLSPAESDFLARVGRESRTPLNAIIGLSEVMMEERFGPIGNARYREYLKDIHVSSSHLLSLINDLLDLSKIEAGKLDLAFAGVSLNGIAQQCVAVMQPQANRERVIIRASLPPTLPQVVADARSVRQIVLNLLSNSIKLAGAGGQVIVSTALDDNGEVVLRVRDTGIGMSEQDLVTALEPFRRLATSVREISAGTGPGLLLAKALAEANRASFRIKSAPKAGTLVEIAFPARARHSSV